MNKRWSNPPEYAVNVAFNNFKDSLGKVIFVLNIPLRTSEMKYMELLYQSDAAPIHYDEAFYIYRFKGIHK